MHLHLVRGRAGLVQRGHKGRVLTAVTAPAGRTALPIVAPRAVNELRWPVDERRDGCRPSPIGRRPKDILSRLEAAYLPHIQST
jgi:hypothetical protein